MRNCTRCELTGAPVGIMGDGPTHLLSGNVNVKHGHAMIIHALVNGSIPRTANINNSDVWDMWTHIISATGLRSINVLWIKGHMTTDECPNDAISCAMYAVK